MSDRSVLYSDKVESLFDLLSFCKKYYCEENIMYLLDVEKLQTLKTDTEQHNMTRKMFKKYFTKGDQYELNLSSKQNERVTKAFGEKQTAAQIRVIVETAEIVQRMVQQDVIPKFREVNAHVSRNTL